MKSNIYTKKNSYTSKNLQSFPNEMMVKILDFVISLSNKNDISQYGWDYKITRSIWD